ncbi:hypothetical protein KDL01_04205 [Actinospica durhamensis]|uniref:Uncharacterized protein n=1 Tax=Actinospica durhamensis TaxID=1508375 RepID=A0A941EH11_9ACTN|nr:hypothetical protein [Actinospica durhamensis]MBR7832445.1 hypothetical protein [Actinospica durhamensis]
MVNQHKHAVRGLRGISDELWNEFEAAARVVGHDRSHLCRQFIEWFVRRPDAELPSRPDVVGETVPSADGTA